MSNIEAYKDVLEDIVYEINIIAMDGAIWGSSDFDRGYISGMFVIMKAMQDKIKTMNAVEPDNDIKMIDVDEWFRLGKDYRFAND